MDTDERYENGVIYTIKTVDGIYVGSTVDFANRKSTHSSRIKSGKMTLLYQNILKHGMKLKSIKCIRVKIELSYKWKNRRLLMN